MSEDFDEKVVTHFQKLLPVMSSVVLLLLAYLPLNSGFFYNSRPDFGLMCIYFWMLHRPDLFGIAEIVVLGIVGTLISASVTGCIFIAYIMMYVLVYNTQKLFNAKSFVVVWYGFMALSLVSMFVKWIIVSVYYNEFLSISMLVFGYLMGIVLYPLVSVVLAFIQNKFIQDDGL